MSEKPHARGKQIIEELYENGPPHSTGLRYLLVPPISKSGIKLALRILKKHKIVADEMTRRLSHAYSYQLSLTSNMRPTILLTRIARMFRSLIGYIPLMSSSYFL